VFDSHLKSTGRDYSLTIALLAVGALLVPASMFANRAAGSGALTIAAAGSLVCLVLAWVNWKRNSQLTIPTIEDERTTTK
jgi:hypothetical protein